MTDQTTQPPPPPRDWREERREERWQRRQDRWSSGGPWIGGVILIVLGVIFLAQNLGAPLPEHWWAVFILIPAFASFSSAWSIYQRNNQQMTAGVRGGILGGCILVALAAALWPVILILLGIAALGGGLWRR